VLDASGRELLSRKVENDEADILKLIDETLSLAEEVAVSAVALRLGRVNHPLYVFDCMLGPRYMGKNACSSVR
jgi:hypothetical protein